MNIGNFELRARSKSYCDLKQKIGAPNLKVKFLTAYEQMDLDFFVDVVFAFAEPRPMSRDAVYEEFDRLMNEGTSMDDIYTQLVEFAYGMGFFGRVDMKEGETIQDFMRASINKMDLDGALANVLDQVVQEKAKKLVL